ncbi:MAG: hypothetical protein A2Z21_09925 [Candidatus Fraserbacteria bacterium RBG_16_55_9]|uniref:AB hydrolase-1 domain-containing protein n=1 Tax=Fraserbacteria sp. (strain RBG_16_55_9) TaxID=1817864 RepID=A0A1F5UWT4_FRAXR|nr:MAG: hypothetical protein A2Z21_09925 [Candidatus Fraserbacteria bacterium RBG_16_55_9]
MPTAKVGSTQVYFQLGGRGQALVFVHGSGADHTLWKYQHQVLESSYSVASLDLNGHGKSPRREGDGLMTYTQDALSVMEALNEPVFLLGHSLGGAIVLNVALQKPANLQAVGLVGTGAKLRVNPQILSTIATDFEEAVSVLLEWEFSPGAPMALRVWRREQMLRIGQTALQRDFTTCDAFSAMECLSEIDVPALVVCGGDDKLTPVKYSQYLKDQLRRARLEIIEGAGHDVMLEQPEALNRVIRGFLEEL